MLAGKRFGQRHGAATRDLLHVEGERVVRLEPLALDDARALFVERARAVRSALDESANAEMVTDRRMSYLPGSSRCTLNGVVRRKSGRDCTGSWSGTTIRRGACRPQKRSAERDAPGRDRTGSDFRLGPQSESR